MREREGWKERVREREVESGISSREGFAGGGGGGGGARGGRMSDRQTTLLTRGRDRPLSQSVTPDKQAMAVSKQALT